MTNNNNNRVTLALATTTTSISLLFLFVATAWRSWLYNVVIVAMTKRWYRAVLSRLEDNTVLLDVGIGTACALMENADLIRSKNLFILGIDYDSQYIATARRAIQENGLQAHVQVACLSIYDEPALQEFILRNEISKKKIDAAYFSGSLSLLPDPVLALHIVQRYCDTVYVTQTFYKSTGWRTAVVWKPFLKYATTIDFGRAVSNEQILKVYQAAQLTVVSHEIINESNAVYRPNSYLSVLKAKR